MRAIILAGGFGTRLQSVVSDVPKPLAPIGGKPFLHWQIDRLAQFGITDVALCLHHQWEKIEAYFATHPVKPTLHFLVEKIPLGTGGSIAHALKSLNFTEPCLLLNGDSFIQLDYAALYAEHQKYHPLLTMTLRTVPDSGRYGTVTLKNSDIIAFAKGENGQPGIINAGVYVIDPTIFANADMPEVFSFEHDFMPQYISAVKPRGRMAEGYFIDIGTPADYARACKELPGIMNS